MYQSLTMKCNCASYIYLAKFCTSYLSCYILRSRSLCPVLWGGLHRSQSSDRCRQVSIDQGKKICSGYFGHSIHI